MLVHWRCGKVCGGQSSSMPILHGWSRRLQFIVPFAIPVAPQHVPIPLRSSSLKIGHLVH
jgi:hypothetical protein